LSSGWTPNWTRVLATDAGPQATTDEAAPLAANESSRRMIVRGQPRRRSVAAAESNGSDVIGGVGWSTHHALVFSETRQRIRGEEDMAKTIEREVQIAGQRFTLNSGDVRRAVRHIDPEPIDRHFVVVGRHRFPPKQVISAVTGLDRADFTTHQARRTLMRLGFVAGRRSRVAASSASLPRRAAPRAARTSLDVSDRGDELDRWLPLVGQWVALKDDEVLHSANTPQQLVGWLNEHGQSADSVFRVPEDEPAATGLAPL